MAKADIHVTLRGGEKDEGGLVRYEPGESMSGTVQVIPDGDVRCNHLYVRLQWHTEGRGDRDMEKVAEMDVFQGTLNAGVPTVHEFYFNLPREPWSYAGHYVNIVWEIAVDVDVPWSVNPRHSQPFIMAPRSEVTTMGGEQTKFNVALTAVGNRKVEVIKAIRDIMPDLGLKEAKDLADSAPILLLKRVSEQRAKEARWRLEAAGATVEIR